MVVVQVIWEARTFKDLTQVHVRGLLPVGVGHVLVDGVQDLLLHLADGVTVQHLHLDLWALLVVRVDAVHHLREEDQPLSNGSAITLGVQL